jgi:hypothetical protein
MEREFSRRVKIRKLGGEDDEVFPVDEERVGWERSRPQTGDRYYVFQDSGKILRTGIVQRVTEGGFDTENSKYRLEEVELPLGTGDLGDTQGIAAAARVQSDRSLRVCRPAKVKIRCADGSTIVGHVNLSCEAEGFDRVSEIFTEGEKPFIVVFNATARGKGENVLVINKAHIIWASPED